MSPFPNARHGAFTLVFTFVAFAPSPSAAQLVPGTPYQLNRGPNTYVPLASPIVLWSNVDDDTLPVTLPFPVKFYETMQTSVSVDSNGAIGFPSNTPVSRFNSAPGTTGSPSGFVAPVWDDLLLNPGANRVIGYQVEGTAPTRTITFEWRNLGFYDFGSVAGNMSFQVRFYEGASGRIDIDYGPTMGTFASSATMGMENTMDAGPILFNSNGCTTTCLLADIPANTRVTVVQDPGVDLVGVGVGAPEFAFLGAETRLPIVVQNLHGMPIGPFTAAVVASSTSDLANPITIGSTSLSLPPFEIRALDVTAAFPTSLGTSLVYVGLVVDSDDVIAEVDENNNTAVANTRVRLLVGKPDLTVERVRTSTTKVDAGGSVQVFARIRNIGGEPATNTGAAIMLSTNPVITEQDLELVPFNVTLAPRETTNATVTVTVDAATNSGSYYIGALVDPSNTLDELSESNNGRADVRPISVVGLGVAIVTTALPNATIGTSYVALLTAAGGDPNDRQWSIDGTLPAGLGIVPSTGELFGRPTAIERQTFMVRVESAGEVATKELSLEVVDPTQPLTIVTREVMSAVVGQEYAFGLVATGGTSPETWVWSGTNLPTGFEVRADGLLIGSPIEASTATITVALTDGADNTTRDLLLNVRPNANLLINPRLLSSARFDEPYEAQLEATGALGPIAWLLEVGRLPAGLALSTTGAITGTPTQVGRFRFVVEARDTAAGLQAKDTNAFEIEVVDDGVFMITTAGLPDAVVGDGYETTLGTMGGLPPIEWDIVEGRLPEGFVGSTNPNTGDFQIAGQTLVQGASTMLIVATDAQGRSATRAFVLRVVPPPPETPDKIDDGCSCTAATDSRGDHTLLLALFVLLVVGRTTRRARDR